MDTSDSQKVYVVFDSPETAVRMTGGEAHSIKGIEYAPKVRGVNKKNSFILTYPNGDKLLYARAGYKSYGKIVNDVAGENISEKGNHADHVGGKAQNKSAEGDLFVLMSEIPASVNMSAGSREHVDRLDYRFQRAAHGQHSDGMIAVPATAHQAHKSKSETIIEFKGQMIVIDHPLADEKIAKSWLQDPQYQSRMGIMKKECIASAKDYPSVSAYEPQKIQGRYPWDNHVNKSPDTAKNKAPDLAMGRPKKT